MKFLLFYILLPLAVVFMFAIADATFARPETGNWALGLAVVYVVTVGFEAEDRLGRKDS